MGHHQRNSVWIEVVRAGGQELLLKPLLAQTGQELWSGGDV